jgi:hypothetical protein
MGETKARGCPAAFAVQATAGCPGAAGFVDASAVKTLLLTSQIRRAPGGVCKRLRMPFIWSIDCANFPGIILALARKSRRKLSPTASDAPDIHSEQSSSAPSLDASVLHRWIMGALSDTVGETPVLREDRCRYGPF